MAEYIEREAVNALIKAECSPKVAAYLIDAVATIPAADVRPVVLCRDCKHWELSKIDPSFRVCTYLCGVSFVRNAEDFCSRGEKRKES